jgi:predicted MFS family arabinose efflux permease
VLAGLAIGNYVGGLLADRFEIGRTLSTLFMAASAASVFITVFDNLALVLASLEEASGAKPRPDGESSQ